jgi:hypothetical protein
MYEMAGDDGPDTFIDNGLPVAPGEEAQRSRHVLLAHPVAKLAPLANRVPGELHGLQKWRELLPVNRLRRGCWT